MTSRPRRLAALALAGLAAAATTTFLAGPATAAPAAPAPIPLRVMGINDFHGNLQPPSGSSGRVTLSDGTTATAGGAAYLSQHVKDLRASAPGGNAVLVGVGDNVGASPLASALFHDEPTIDLFNLMGAKVSAIGNHEFDEGYAELLRLQRGGCHPVDGCQFRDTFPGADFVYAGANVTFSGVGGTPLFRGFPAALPFGITFVQGVPVGYIGTPLEGTPDVVTKDAIRNLQFGDEVAAIDRTADLLDRFGVKTIVALVHEGDSTVAPGGPSDCNARGGHGTDIATAVTPKVDAVMTAHTHQQYICSVTDPAGNPRPFVQGLSFGRLVTVLDLQIDPRTRDVIRTATQARNEVVTRDVADPAAQALVDEAVSKSAPIANRQVGTITADITRAGGAGGVSPLGTVVADAQLAATTVNGAQLALTNPGGVRADLTYTSSPAGEGDGVVTYGEAFTTQPFANILQTVTLTGAQLDTVLEQQFHADGTSTVLQPSTGLTYTVSTSAAVGAKVSGIALDGVPVAPTDTVRVTINNFLAGGGDGFPGLTVGTDLTGGPIDLDAFTAYLTANPGLAPPVPAVVTTVP
ncbi:bifunctional metallophosphatase/5'-nucleotidase [Rhodococcus aerolatus]